MMIMTLPSSVDLPADLLQWRPDLDPAALRVVLVPVLPDKFTPPGAGMDVQRQKLRRTTGRDEHRAARGQGGGNRPSAIPT
jgi:hypothetical protein